MGTLITVIIIILITINRISESKKNLPEFSKGNS